MKLTTLLCLPVAAALLACPSFVYGNTVVNAKVLGELSTSPGYPLIQGRDGNFYGADSGGGSNESGAVLKTTPLGVVTPLYTFSATDPATDTNQDGTQPDAPLVQGSDGNFYGLAAFGGPNNAGTAFSLTPAGVFTVLHQFSTAPTDGFEPLGGLVQGNDGNFYGVTYQGGVSSEGTVFQLTPAGGFTVLHSFTDADGRDPGTGLVKGSDGNFYGVTQDGGSGGNGTIFQITPAGGFTVLHSFASDGSEGQGAFTLVSGGDGNFYDVTAAGGSAGNGTIFRITPAGVFTSLYSFSATDDDNENGDGVYPTSMLALGGDGNLYGTTLDGGNAGYGTNFRITPAGVFTAFDLSAASVISRDFFLGIDGNIYGVDNTELFRLELGATATSTPTVSVAAGGSGVAMEGGAKGQLIVTRTGDMSAALTVAYKVKGSAKAGVDYKQLPGTVTIPAGASKAKIKIKPIDGSPNAGVLKIKFALLPATDGSYTVGTGTAKIKLVGK